jgi:hypothetical protein
MAPSCNEHSIPVVVTPRLAIVFQAPGLAEAVFATISSCLSVVDKKKMLTGLTAPVVNLDFSAHIASSFFVKSSISSS